MPKGYPNKNIVKTQISTDDIGVDSPVRTNLASDVNTEDLDRIAVVTDDTLESPLIKARVRELAFNEEPITFMVQQTTDKNAENPVMSGVNGEIRKFQRGVIYKDIPRKFIASLIKKETNVETVNYVDSQGLNQTDIKETNAIKTNIQIIKDPSPHANAWFEWMVQSPV